MTYSPKTKISSVKNVRCSRGMYVWHPDFLAIVVARVKLLQVQVCRVVPIFVMSSKDLNQNLSSFSNCLHLVESHSWFSPSSSNYSLWSIFPYQLNAISSE